MKKTILTAISGFALLFAILFVGCQQEDQVAPDSKLTYRARPGSLPPDQCLPNNPTWTFSEPCAGDDLNVTVCFNADCGQAQIQYESAPGVWTQIIQENPLTGSCLTGTIANAAAGIYNFRTMYISSGGGCNFCDVHFEGANQNEFSHNSITVVPCGVCYGPGESAWSDGPEYVPGGNWATYTPVGDFPATLFAGQTMDAGTVSYGGGNITITLNAGWEFANVSENVKIQGYVVAPTQEPGGIGLFTYKSTAPIGSSPYSVPVAAFNFYGVHVDVVPIVECPE